MDEEWRESFMPAEGVQLHCVATGDTTAPLMLFLHGFPEFWYAWRCQLREFGRDFHAVAPDLRGYNLSEKPKDVEQYQMEHLVADVRALIASLGHERCVLVGHDWGGAIAWATASAAPELISKLIIINAPHPAVFGRELRDNGQQQRASTYMLLFRRPNAEESLAAHNFRRLRTIFGAGLFNADEAAAYLAAWSQPGALTGGLNYYRAMRLPGAFSGETPPTPRDTPVDRATMTIAMPTLVIWGERDTALLTGNLDRLDDYVPDLTLQRIPDGSHWVIHEHPDRVNQLIRTFVTQ